MDFYKGEDRILFIKVDNVWLPIGCLTDNSMDESSDFLDTTTRDNQGWKTSRPTMQSYNISFSGLQINTTIAGGSFNIASYDRLKILKRDRTLLDWKVQGTIYPIVDYGKFYIANLSDANTVGELITFTGSATGYGKPLTASLGTVVLNNGNPDVIINDGNPDIILRTNEI